jgi:hypothetical protein
MQNLSHLLDRFKNLQAPERSVRKATIDTVKEIVGVELHDEQIKIQNESILYLSPTSAIKAAIFEEKHSIISRINNILAKEQIKDIK